MTTLFGDMHRPIPLPDPPRISRSDAEVIFRADLTLTQWEKLTDKERADIRWRVGI
ncbi:hypothetical protein PP357_gp43 [Arthrobacter phage Sarge]|uniref:Uncharacterized protein n=1 Tax=Arthrobacter phage Sarge TaxID=2885974 RepID=A0AAE9C1J5_9CAUD|nr:hypothetical protein PP357_gp43 [Arthrobacter phage Sarge]UDL14890.1 hypothetical protein SEA_SARGE_43 [Arthrobacter phage Sarge]